MNEFENFPTPEELLKKHESKIFRGSHDVSESTHVGGIGLSVRRPTEGAMYGLFLDAGDGIPEEEIAMIGGSTAEAEEVFAKATQILGMGLKLDEAKAQIGKFIVELHGGLRKAQ